MRSIATKLAREIKKSKRSKVIDLAEMRQLRERLSANDLEQLGPATSELLHRFKWVTMSAQFLLGSDTLAKLRDKIETADDAYMPGMPPQSPVLDSLFMGWMLCDLTVGPQSETLATLLADLAPVLGVPRELAQDARAYAASRLGIYRVDAVDGSLVTLFDLIEQRDYVVHQLDDWAEEGELWFARVVKSPEGFDFEYHVPATPYLLSAPLREWEAYFERISASRDPSILRAHFKHPPTPSYWLDYALDGYDGVEDIMIWLAGVPDRPEALPHSIEKEDSSPKSEGGGKAPRVAAVRAKLWERAESSGLAEESDAYIDSLVEPLGGLASLSKYGSDLNFAFQIYGFLDGSDSTVLDSFSRSAEGRALKKDEASELKALLRGWFSVFEIRLVRIDEGLELFDTWRRKVLFVREKSGTRGASTGDVLCAYVMSHEDGTYTLEGALLHVPRAWAPAFVEQMRAFRDIMKRSSGHLGWKKRAGVLMGHTIFVYEAMARNPPIPQLVNFSGEELVWAEAHYDILDVTRVRACLDELAERDGEGDEWSASNEKALEAQLYIKKNRLLLRCNSRERLKRWKDRLNQSLDGAALWKADSLTDGQAALKESRNRSASKALSKPESLPPDVQKAVAEHIQGMMNAWMDEPIPQLGNKSPREAVRSRRGKDQVTELLVNQERSFANNPQFALVDVSFLWKELGLPHPDR